MIGWEWRERAACKGSDPGLFFGPELTAEGKRQPKLERLYEHKARSICNGESVDGVIVRGPCPVRRECLVEAMPRIDGTGGELWGVWGGYTAMQRQRLLDTGMKAVSIKLSPAVPTKKAVDGGAVPTTARRQGEPGQI